MKETISLKWIRNGELGVCEVNRQEFLQRFQELVKNYPDNNEISQKLVKIIPHATQIKINYDINQTQDTPVITYRIHNDVLGILKILRHHKIVWNTLNEYCKD